MQHTRRSGISAMIVALFVMLQSTVCAAQGLDTSEPALLAKPDQRLLVEQIEELILAGEFDEATANLEKLFDQGLGRIVKVGAVQRAGTLQTQRYIPMRGWTQRRLARLIQDEPEHGRKYQNRMTEVARVTLEDLGRSKDMEEARQAADRYYACELGPQFSLLLCDLYLESGLSIAAIQAAQQASPELRVNVGDPSTLETLPWVLIWKSLGAETKRAGVLKQLQKILNDQTVSGRSKAKLLVESLLRVVMAAALTPNAVDKQAVLQWGHSIAGLLDEVSQERLTKRLAEAESWTVPVPNPGHWPVFGGTNSRCRCGPTTFDPAAWPTWSRLLERYTATSDRTAASKPRAGESARGTLPYHPVVDGGRVFVNELTRIVAFDLTTGRPWPDLQTALPLFDSNRISAAFIPRGYPLVGTPRGTLAIHEQCLYARMGNPITGSANHNAAADGGSKSYLIGLDLERQGSMLPGFPKRLTTPDFEGAEFDGAPLISGDNLFVTIIQRDNVGLRRSVACFDRFNGDLKWRSGELAGGNVEGSDRANLISHQLLTLEGGRLYYNTNLGSIVCLDPLTGRIEWLTRYSRSSKKGQTYLTPDRFRYRDVTPCMISGGLVYCAPQDCPEIFALDATTGDLVWSTDDHDVADAIHLLGVHQDCLLASGDRLIWLDRSSGKVLARFPGSTTPGITNALPSPRGMGRGVISGGQVYWPTAGKLFVFPASIQRTANHGKPAEAPPMLRRVRMSSHGSEGGNLVALGNTLLFAGPTHIMAFEQ